MKKIALFVIAIIGFIANIMGITGVTLRLGSIFLPNPVIIVATVVLSMAGWYAAFYLGSLYGPYLLIASLFHMQKSLPFRKFLLGYAYEWLMKKPLVGNFFYRLYYLLQMRKRGRLL